MTLLIFYLAIAIGVSFLCSILEAVLLSTTPSYIETLKSERPRAGDVVDRVKQRLDESLAAILILNTFAHTMGAFGVGAQALMVFGPQWETLIAVLLTLAILYFSEIIPKTLGATFWRALLLPSAYLILWLIKLVYPLVWISTRLTSLFGRDAESEITREEILAMASLGKKGGALIAREREYLSNVLSLREVATEEVLTPRTVVHMLEQNMHVSDALDDPRTRQFSRMPVYDESPDIITGKVLRHDLFMAERSGHGAEPVKNFAKQIIAVSEKLPVVHLLELMLKNRVHLCLVEDEFGQASGIVTLEDAIETLLGREIVDESDAVEDMQELARDKYRERLRDSKVKPPSQTPQ
ncbi:MAG: HlyC/CorC family transporter [Gammaproteobacteria bacterium]|nr:MAG: HlyC/CorC family transporter [Gammaproteobacteria bacterium]UCH41624.1 MAG: HlyC/CorC family transporter [Gammaproteobacteria bacterium]